MTGDAAGKKPNGASSGLLLILIGSFFISFSAVFVKLAHIPPTVSGVYRNVFGASALLLYVVITRTKLWRGSTPLFWAAVAAVFFAADIYFWHRSILYIGPGLATIIGNFQVFALAAVGILVFREKATWRFLVSIPLAMFGLFLLVGLEWGKLGPQYKIGVAFGLLTAAMYAGYLLTMRRSGRAAVRLEPAANLFWVTTITATLLWVVTLTEDVDMAIPDTQSWVAMVSLGVICQALAWVIILRGLATVPASRAGLILLLQPALTFVWDVLFFDRPTTTFEVAGALLAMGAIYLGSARTGRS